MLSDLARDPGRLVGKEALIEAVWGGAAVEPILDPLRNEPRFAALVQPLGLPGTR